MITAIVGRVETSVAAVSVRRALHTDDDTGCLEGIFGSRAVGALDSQVNARRHPQELFDFNSASSFGIVAARVHCSKSRSSARKPATCRCQCHGDAPAATNTVGVDHRRHQPLR